MNFNMKYLFLFLAFTHLSTVSAQAVRPGCMEENVSGSSKSLTKRDTLGKISKLVKEKADILERISHPVSSINMMPKSDGLDHEAFLKEIEAFFVRCKEEELRRQADLDRLMVIDREASEVVIKYYQDENRGTGSIDRDVAYITDPRASAFEGTTLGTWDVKISVPNKAQKDFYATPLPHLQPELWFGMERITSANVGYWQQRLGWEATMSFGKAFEETVGNSIFILGSTPSQGLDSEIESRLLKRTAYWPSFGKTYAIARQENLIALRGAPLSSAPVQFQQTYEGTKKDVSIDPNINSQFIGPFDGFKMNLETYRDIPTWVAYICSGPADQAVSKSRELTSSDIKIITTVAIEGPFYSPLGIFNSPIAKASNASVSRLSIPLHVEIARTMRVLDPELRAMITRPLEQMTKVFKSSGIPYQAGFGEVPNNPNKPYIMRGYSVSNAYTFVDTTSGNEYALSMTHPFSMHPSLGGIARQDMKYPFVVFDIDSLTDYRN